MSVLSIDFYTHVHLIVAKLSKKLQLKTGAHCNTMYTETDYLKFDLKGK